MKGSSTIFLQMESRIAALEGRVTRIEEHSEEMVIVLREITTNEVRAEVIDLRTSGETLYYSDIADRLRRSPRTQATPMGLGKCSEWRLSARYCR